MGGLNDSQKRLRRVMAVRKLKPHLLDAINAYEKISKVEYFDEADDKYVLETLIKLKKYLDKVESEMN